MQIPIYLNENLIKILKQHDLTPHSYKPAYGGESAAIDLYNVGPDITLDPTTTSPSLCGHTRLGKLIPTGLHISLPKEHAALLRERGSIIKTPLTLRAGVIDPGYTDQIFVNLVNLSSQSYTINAGAKLPVQLLVTKVYTDFSPVTYAKYKVLTSDAKRLAGKVGSSD